MDLDEDMVLTVINWKAWRELLYDELSVPQFIKSIGKLKGKLEGLLETDKYDRIGKEYEMEAATNAPAEPDELPHDPVARTLAIGNIVFRLGTGKHATFYTDLHT